jgi:CRP/FNR family transcriptional regulator, cyclic AMP receptor protein
VVKYIQRAGSLEVRNYFFKGVIGVNEDTLARVDLFSTLTKKELQTLAKSSQERSYSAGKTIFSQGDTGTGLYVVKSGKIRITQAQDPDKAEEELTVLGPGGVMGEMALLDDLPRSATATAVEDVTALVLPVWEFRTILHSNPDIGTKLLAVLSRRLRKAENRMQSH